MKKRLLSGLLQAFLVASMLLAQSPARAVAQAPVPFLPPDMAVASLLESEFLEKCCYALIITTAVCLVVMLGCRIGGLP